MRKLIVGAVVTSVPDVFIECVLVHVLWAEQCKWIGHVLLQDLPVQQTMLLRRHHKVVSVVLVVDDVLQGNAELVVEVVEEVLLVDKGDPTDLVHNCLSSCPFVGEVRGDGDRKLATELLPPEARNSDVFAFSSNENVGGSACHGMIAWCDRNSPKVVVIVRLLNARKRDPAKYLDAKDKSSLQKNTLKSPNADVVHGSRTEARVEVLCSQRFEVLNDPRPQMKNIVSGKGSPLFNYGDPGSQELGFYGGPQTTRTGSNNGDPRIGGLHVLLVDGMFGSLIQHFEQVHPLAGLQVRL